MRKHLFLALAVFLALPLTTFARHPHADTIGMKVSRTYRTIHSTVIVEQTMDSIISLDAATGENRISIVTVDTLIGEETIETIDTTFFIAESVRHWRLESRFGAGINMTARGYWEGMSGNNLLSFDLRNTSSAIFERGLSTWRNTFEWRYTTQTQGGEFRNWLKTNDLLNLQSRYSFRASPLWRYSAQFQSETQLTRTFASIAARDTNNYSSRFLSPARLSFSIGMEYVNPSESVKLLLSPITYRATFVRDESFHIREHFGVLRRDPASGEFRDSSAHWLHTFGPMAQLEITRNLANNITLSSNLMIFADILHTADPFVLFDWRIGLDIQLSRLFSLGLETHIVYNPNTFFDTRLRLDSDGNPVRFAEPRRRWQIQQGVLLRFTYRITN
ncbi:MAG: DUF3078 domain-containing protein [Bacteroidales bacterium]|nr:DUF3078 domain-containing protein [Bacteroidales bacterium]